MNIHHVTQRILQKSRIYPRESGQVSFRVQMKGVSNDIRNVEPNPNSRKSLRWGDHAELEFRHISFSLLGHICAVKRYYDSALSSAGECLVPSIRVSLCSVSEG